MTTYCNVSYINVKSGDKSRVRSLKNKCLEFVVTWEDEDITTEPISNLIDFELQNVNIFLIPYLSEYIANVKVYPNIKRRCWFCNRQVTKGESLCHVHQANEGWIIDFVNDDAMLIDLPLICSESSDDEEKEIIKDEVDLELQTSRLIL